MDRHPLSAAYRDMTATEYAALEADIRAHGLRDRITRYEGKVLDGWHRYRACRAAGVEPAYDDFEGTAEEAAAYVYSKNGPRRHLSPEEQRAAAASRKARVAGKRAAGKSIRQIAEEEGVSKAQVERDVIEGSGVPGGTPEHPSPAPQVAPEVIVNLPQPPPYLVDVIALAKAGKTRFEIAEAIGKKPEAVRVYLIRARQAGYLPSPPGGRTTGADGKTYPAGRRPATTEENKSPAPSANGARHDESLFGIGMTVANKVIRSLRKIPRDDRSRVKGLREVLRWITDNM